MRRKRDNKLVSRMFNRYMSMRLIAYFILTIDEIFDSSMGGSTIGTDALAAIGMMGVLMTIIYGIFMGFITGAIVRVSFYQGKGNVKKASEVYTLSLIAIVLFMALFCGAIYLFQNQVVWILGARGRVVSQYALEYVKGLLPYLFTSSVANYLVELDAIQGDNYVLPINSSIETIGNIGFTLLFTFVFHWGVFGLSFGTSVGSFISFVVIIIFRFLRKKRTVRICKIRSIACRNELVQVVRVGSLSSLDTFVDFAQDLALNNYLMIVFGVTGVAIYSAFKSVFYFIVNIEYAVRDSVAGVTASLFAAKDWSAIKHILTQSIRKTIGMEYAACILFIVFSQPILACFGITGGVIYDSIRLGLLFSLLEIPCMVLTSIATAYYQTTDNMGLSTLCAITPDGIFRVPLMILLSLIISSEVYLGFWIGFAMSPMITIASLYILVWRKKGYHPRNVSDFMLIPTTYVQAIVYNNSIKTEKSNHTSTSIEVMEFLTDHDISHRVASHCGLYLEELVSYISIHAKHKIKKRRIDVKVIILEKEIILQVRDDGMLQNPLLLGTMDEMSGIGIRLIKNMAAKTSYANYLGFNTVTVTLLK